MWFFFANVEPNFAIHDRGIGKSLPNVCKATFAGLVCRWKLACLTNLACEKTHAFCGAVISARSR